MEMKFPFEEQFELSFGATVVSLFFSSQNEIYVLALKDKPDDYPRFLLSRPNTNYLYRQQIDQSFEKDGKNRVVHQFVLEDLRDLRDELSSIIRIVDEKQNDYNREQYRREQSMQDDSWTDDRPNNYYNDDLDMDQQSQEFWDNL